MTLHTYEWWEERLEIDHMESTDPGRRSFFAGCPVHGGSDSLHVTEKNDKALVKCFGCDAKYGDIVDALESGVDRTETVTVPTISRKAGSRAARTAVSSTVTPLDWCATRCGMSRKELDELALPLSEEGDLLVFEFEGRAQKTREVGEGKKKAITWRGSVNPPFWPVPTKPDVEITITEGEFDAIVLIEAGYDAYSITGGAGSTPDVAAFVALKALGVERVVVAFDEDEAGRKGRSVVTEAIRAADLIAIYGRPKGLQPLFDEKDARDIAVRGGLIELEDHPDTELDVTVLADVVPAVDKALLLGRLDPDDHTILFGDGGAGKGMIAAWWTSCLTRGWDIDKKVPVFDPKTVLILDYESHAETEWRKRVEKFGGDLKRVHIVRPAAAIWDIAGSVAELVKELRVDYVVVDSALYACTGADAYTPEGATQYTLAIAQFRRPVLTLAHKTKSKDDQDKPFGSVFWHNGARLTISVDAKGYDDPRELHTRKANHGADFHRAIEWGWVGTGLPDRLDEIDLKGDRADEWQQVHDALEATLSREPTHPEIALAMGISVENSKQIKHRLAKAVTVNGKQVTAKEPE